MNFHFENTVLLYIFNAKTVSKSGYCKELLTLSFNHFKCVFFFQFEEIKECRLLDENNDFRWNMELQIHSLDKGRQS